MPTDLPQSGDNPDNRSASPSGSNPSNGVPSPRQPGHDGASFRIAVVAGIPIRIHITFLLLLAWFSLEGAQPSRGKEGAGVLFILLIFVCVLLHELSHSLVARQYGVRTVSITLYPIGGIAVLDRPASPRKELWIALAGPAMNILIAGGLFAGLAATRTRVGAFHLGQSGSGLVVDLAWANLLLGAFNMIPAFPMDGGRVLRSLISRVTTEERATQIASRVGQLLAISFGIYALTVGDFMLFLVAAFVYLGAGQEAQVHRMRTLVLGHRVREAMQTEFHTLQVGSTLKEAAQALLAGSQRDFPIVYGGEVLGLLSRDDLMRGIAADNDSGSSYVAGAMNREFPRTVPDADLDSVIAGLGKAGTVLVFDSDAANEPKLVGMLTQENAIEFLMLEQLANRRRRQNG